jgi:predicted nucleic acid-binding protein
MIVVADSSPLVVLVNIGQIDLLRALFQQILIPPDVAAELASAKRPEAVRAFDAISRYRLVSAPALPKKEERP